MVVNDFSLRLVRLSASASGMDIVVLRLLNGTTLKCLAATDSDGVDLEASDIDIRDCASYGQCLSQGTRIVLSRTELSKSAPVEARVDKNIKIVVITALKERAFVFGTLTFYTRSDFPSLEQAGSRCEAIAELASHVIHMQRDVKEDLCMFLAREVRQTNRHAVLQYIDNAQTLLALAMAKGAAGAAELRTASRHLREVGSLMQRVKIVEQLTKFGAYSLAQAWQAAASTLSERIVADRILLRITGDATVYSNGGLLQTAFETLLTASIRRFSECTKGQKTVEVMIASLPAHEKWATVRYVDNAPPMTLQNDALGIPLLKQIIERAYGSITMNAGQFGTVTEICLCKSDEHQAG